MAFPRLGRSPRSAIEKLNGRYNGQAFAFPRGRRALDSDVAVDTSLRTKVSLDSQIFHHFTNQLKTPLFKTKTQSRIKRSLYNKKYALAHRFGYYSKQPPNNKVITPHSVAQDTKRASQFPMPRSSSVHGFFFKDHNSSPEIDMSVSKQGPQEHSEKAEQPMHEVSKPENNENDIELRNLAGGFFARPMPRSNRNSAEISNKFPLFPISDADYLLIHRRKFPMPRSNVAKRSLRSQPILSSSFLTDWWNTAQKLNKISKQFLSNRPKTVQRSVFIMPKRLSDPNIPTNTKRTGFYPMPRNAKRNGFYPMPRSAKRDGFYPMPRSAKRTGFYPMPRSAKRTGFYPMPRSEKRTGFYPMPRSAKRTGFYPMPRSAKRDGFYPMPRSAKRTGFYPMPRSAKRDGFYPMPRSTKRTGFYPMPKRTGFYPMPRSAKRDGFYPMPRSAKRTGFYPMPRSAKRTGFYPMPRSAKRTNFYPMPRKRTDIRPLPKNEYQLPLNLLVRSKRSVASSFSISAEQQDRTETSRDTASSGYYPMPRDTAKSGYYPMPRDTSSSGYYPMPRDTAKSGYYPMPRDTSSSGYYPMPRDTAKSGYYPMPRDGANSGNYPMPRDTAQPGYYPMPRDTKDSGYYPMPRDVEQKGYFPMPREVAGDLGLTPNMTDTGEKLINDSKWMTSLDVIALVDILKNNGLEENGKERSLSKMYEWLDQLKKVCSDGYSKCPSLLHEIRGYLAFPRLGRSDQSQTIQSSEFEAECCPEGIKSHWIVIGASKPEIRSRCSPKSVCCEGLEELVGRSSEHIFYTKCVAKITDEKTENTVLDRLLRKS